MFDFNHGTFNFKGAYFTIQKALPFLTTNPEGRLARCVRAPFACVPR